MKIFIEDTEYCDEKDYENLNKSNILYWIKYHVEEKYNYLTKDDDTYAFNYIACMKDGTYKRFRGHELGWQIARKIHKDAVYMNFHYGSYQDDGRSFID